MTQSFRELLITNFGLQSGGYTGSQGAVGYTGSGAASATTEIYNTVAALPSSGVTNGTLAYVSANNALYVQSDSQWKRVYTGSDSMLDVTTEPAATALINFTANSVQQHSVTFAATDPEGFPVTYDYAVNPADSVNVQSVTNNNGVYDLQLTANASTLGSAIFRMNATDGLHVVSRYQTLNFIIANPISLSGGTGGGPTTAIYTAPNGTVVTATDNTYNGPTYGLVYLFDNTPSTAYWLSQSAATGSLTFDFSNSTVQFLYSVQIYPRSRDDTYTSVTSIQISTDGVSWTVVPGASIAVTSSTAYGFSQTFVLNTQTHRYVRLNLSKSGSWGLSLNEVVFTGATAS